ncbi:hypothetical protein DdX_01576 [Ditylenchus destructor]|uniref:Uncharacterized protein n=1 Tax=Ditylenchus destructor TaxID=166010 RepID=A0AAD4NH16_9BILA|nr:hypothetical protein DdX_01576 [Ditylenchus destructor]
MMRKAKRNLEVVSSIVPPRSTLTTPTFVNAINNDANTLKAPSKNEKRGRAALAGSVLHSTPNSATTLTQTIKHKNEQGRQSSVAALASPFFEWAGLTNANGCATSKALLPPAAFHAFDARPSKRLEKNGDGTFARDVKNEMRTLIGYNQQALR